MNLQSLLSQVKLGEDSMRRFKTADQLPTEAGVDKLDKLRFRDFLNDVCGQEYSDSSHELIRARLV